MPEIRFDGSIPEDENDPDGFQPLLNLDDDEGDEELCENLDCPECYPELQDDEISGEYEPEEPPDADWTINSESTNRWQFTHNPAAQIQPDITEDEARRRQQQSLDEAMARMRRIINETRPRPDNTSEGEEVPVNPEEMPVPNEGEFVRPCPIPQIRGVIFQSRAQGRTIRYPGTINSRDNVQVSFWDLRPNVMRDSYNGLREWLNDNGFGIAGTSADHYSEAGMSANIPYYFTIQDIGPGVTPADDILLQPACTECETEHQFPTLYCGDCDTPLYCQTCRGFNEGVQNDVEYGTYCNNCSFLCNENEEHGRYHRNQGDMCPICHPRTRCASCTDWMYEGQDNVNTHIFQTGATRNYCDRCYECLCQSCDRINDRENMLPEEGNQCIACVSRNNNEEWDEENLEAEELVIPTIPGREVIRLVGVEIEGANGDDIVEREGGNILARALYDAGLSSMHSMGGYHSSEGRRMTVHVERDSSVDWELVIGPLNVADPTQVGTLNQSVRVVRNLINDRTLKLDMRAGLHVHVEAAKVPFEAAYNLHRLYMNMEDFLYRLGAAKWPYHRSVNRRGRDQAGKSPNTEGKLHFARTFAGQRYYGLSFDNYFARYFDHCECGARNYGLFAECECNLGKCTFEFRLFNTTANTRKIHAYLAISQALVAKAITMEEITERDAFPPLDFTKTKVSDMHPSTRRKMVNEWEKRIVFVNEQLPLTPEEKASIHYCVMNCEMGKVVSNADILLESEEN